MASAGASKAAKVARTLPKIKAEIGHIHQRLKTANFENPRGRLEILRRMITRLVREERCEFKHNRAVECRPYMERIIQLGIHHGPDDVYTMEMVKWWLMEPALINKLFDDIVPRLRDTEEPYTYLMNLPAQRIRTYKDSRVERYFRYDIAALEINGNPFPSLRPLEEKRVELLKELVKKAALEEKAKRQP